VTLRTTIAELGDVPWLLRITALASIALGIIFPAITLIPGADFNLAGSVMSHGEIWASGVAVAIMVVAPLMLAIGFGILLHRRWVRVPLILLPILQYLPFQAAHWLFGAPNPTPSIPQYVIFCVAWAAIASIYLFASSRAKRYFQSVRA
jgi:hypothetical protein